MAVNRRLLTINEVAMLLGVDRHVVYRLRDTGELPVLHLGERRQRIDREDVDRWIESRKRVGRLMVQVGG
ncbi:MAG: helix-turn-helix domain-containing protein [Dehalococcoidia bacterium]|nr:helix-turn-helix domain-containing protein [Dehalococcoidia bacterium]